MTTLTDIELEALLSDLESDRAERKESWAGNAPEKGCQAVCAFANDLPNHQSAGVLFVGAQENGQPSGFPITDELLTTLADIRSNGNIIPPPTLTVQKRRLKDADMAVVTVLPADAPPVRYKGRIWIRVGPSRRIATAQDERILSEKRRFRDRYFESHPIAACPLSQLSRAIFEQEYLPSAFAPDALAANDRSYEQRLAACGMAASVDEPIPTVLGILCLGISPRTWIPGAYVQFLRIRGTQLTDPVVDEAEIAGALAVTVRRLEEKLKAYLTTSVDFTSGPTEVRLSPYPITALEQLARNAILHRTYEHTNAPVRVYWFDDRIEIFNPGGPFGAVNAENFGQPGRADYRNPQLAAAFKVLGFAQRFGAGIALARKALADNGNPPPEFQIETNFVAAIIRLRP